MIFWLIVLTRIVANPFSNVFQKLLTGRGADPLFIIGATHGLLTLVCLPTFLFLSLPTSSEFWLNIAICAVLAVAGNVLIVLAMARSDLSVLGPLNAYKAVVSLLPSLIVLGEFPRLIGVIGIVLIVAGSYFLMDRDPAKPSENTLRRFLSDRGIQLRLAALVFSATEAVFLKKALWAASPLTTFAVWSILGFIVAYVFVALLIRGPRLGEQAAVMRGNGITYLALAATTGLMQLCTLYTLTWVQVGYALALFQTSALLHVLLGHRVFQEPRLFQRLLGAGVMVVGAILIVLGR